ncbi:MAG: CDP-alcohol phosphatidyltransferase family protein, partial [Clostridia bacterium]|nr:CDP-alcohol phosphatidyltransferase family protein [Clostridia bacterium]
MKLNIPNRLTLLRIIMVPVFLVLLVAVPFRSETVRSIVCASVFLLTCLTDTLDGIIARRKNMITDLGKFLDPLADKFLVFAALLGILVRYDHFKYVFIWAAAVVIFRELAVTSLRLVVVGKSDVVIAA